MVTDVQGVHYLFLTCSWLVHDLFMTCSLTCSWHVYHNLLTTCSWLVHNLFKTCTSTCSWLVLTCLQLVHDLFMTCSWLVYQLVHQLVHDLLMTCLWLVYVLLINCSCTTCSHFGCDLFMSCLLLLLVHDFFMTSS